MKPTYDASSKIFLACKAAVVPPILGLLKVLSECFPESVSAFLLALMVAIFIFLIDSVSLKIADFLNRRAIRIAVESIDKQVADLEGCFEADPTSSINKIVTKKIVDLKKLKVQLLGNR